MDRYGDVDNFESHIKSEVKDENGNMDLDDENQYLKKLAGRPVKKQQRPNPEEDD
jgi:hypothetical protein